MSYYSEPEQGRSVLGALPPNARLLTDLPAWISRTDPTVPRTATHFVVVQTDPSGARIEFFDPQGRSISIADFFRPPPTELIISTRPQRKWLGVAIFGGGIVVAGGIVMWAMARKKRVATNRRRRRR